MDSTSLLLEGRELGGDSHPNHSPQSPQQAHQRKICTKCLADLPLTDFYSMGSRVDSWCKECKKSKRRSKYVSTKSVDTFDRLKRCLDLLYAVEMKELTAIYERLERMVAQCQKRD